MSGEEHDDMPHDPLPELIAGIDQMIAGAPHLARAARGFYNAFKGEGFTDKEALYLTAAQLNSGPGGPS